ncbi:IS30 family transposase [Actinopolyspora erythraea]
MEQGYSSREACRIVGIDPRTGKKWRNGHHSPGLGQKPVPPAGRGERDSSGSSRYLREDERLHIADRRREKAGIRTIARELGRYPSTISRELRRNATVVGGVRPRTIYRPHAAQAHADARKPRPKTGKIAANPQLAEAIQGKLHRKWSPEQIVCWLRRTFPARPEMRVCWETIYQALYSRTRSDLHRSLARSLRTGRSMRKPRRQAQCRRPRFLTPMVMLDQRPAEADDRAVPSHWEGDLVIGRGHQTAMATLVERTTRYLMIVALPHGRLPERVREALASHMQAFPPSLTRSLTWDQGSEMSAHAAFTADTGIPVYFCPPASPWQRGSNENTNGLLRQYFPKGTDLPVHDQAQLDAVAAELNHRPRKTLGWESPAERFTTLTTTNN